MYKEHCSPKKDIMQIPKKEVKARILNAAKAEFLNYGFKGTSMRNISKIAQISTSNIYNYYTNKNELLKDVLKPLMNKFKEIQTNHNAPEFLNLEVFESPEYKNTHIELFVDLICTYKEELKLLLFHSYGSDYENFRETFSDNQVKIGKEYLKLLKINHPDININIPDFFMHTFSSWIFGTIGELVFHDVSEKELRVILDNYFTFTIAGWNKLIENSN